MSLEQRRSTIAPYEFLVERCLVLDVRTKRVVLVEDVPHVDRGTALGGAESILGRKATPFSNQRNTFVKATRPACSKERATGHQRIGDDVELVACLGCDQDRFRHGQGGLPLALEHECPGKLSTRSRQPAASLEVGRVQALE